MNYFPDLPVDVARYILEIAALHDRESAYHFVYVSKAVREWIDPILYHTVVLKDSHAQDLFVQSCNRRLIRDADFIARNVKVLCIHGMTTYPRVKPILFYCTGVEVLAAWFRTEPGIPFPCLWITFINARRLSLTNNGSKPLECVTPSLTHLNLPHHPAYEEEVDWAGLFHLCPNLTHILLDIVGEHVEDWDEELLSERTVSKLRVILNVAPLSFKALILEVLERDDGSPMNDEGMEVEDLEYPGRFGQAEGFDVAAADLINVMSDRRFVLMVPNNRFAYVSGLVCYEYTHNPVVDWCYRVEGELDAFDMADRHLSTVEDYII